jgi:hypothetical protein
MGKYEQNSSTLTILRWIARVWGTAIVALVLLFVLMHTVSPDAPAPTTREWIGLLFFPFGVCAGLVLAWRWEGPGGAVTLASFILFYAWMFLSGGNLPRGPWFAFAAAPGILYLTIGVISILLERHGANA